MSLGALAAWLLVAAAVAAAMAIFRLKVRPPRLDVPTLVLWARVFDDKRPDHWWDRIRRAVSLVLTAAIALALALAVARPFSRNGGAAEGRLLIVIDSSWSMAARRSHGGTRWDEAIRGARALVHASMSGDVVLATTADGLVEGPTSDAALIDTALSRIAPGGGEDRPWPRIEGVSAVHFFTDGAVARPLDRDVIVHSVFESAPNVAITAFVARPPTSSASSGEAYLEVSNYAASAQDVHVIVSRETARIVDRTVRIGAGDALRDVVPLDAAGGARLAAHVSAAANALDVDDAAVAWLATSDPIRVELVSESPGPLADLLRHDPNVRATVVRPADYAPHDADVVVFDRWAPVSSPARPALCLAPPAVPWVGRAGPEEATPHWETSAAHPVLDGVDPFTLEIARVHTYRSGGLVPIAKSGSGTPIVTVIDSPDTRAVVLGFSTAESNLASTPAFPVLIGNALEWLAHPASGEPRTPGPMELAAATARVTGPDGAAVPIVRAGDRALVDLKAPGLYLIEAGGSRRVVGVNVGRPAIANLLRTSLPPEAPRATTARLAARPWWIAALAAAFVLVVIEWLTWQRRVTV